MAYTKPDEGDTILHTHITQLTNALDGTADAGEPIQATEVDDATHYAVDARNKNATGLHFRLRNTAGEDMMKAALSTLTFYKNIVVAANITFDGVDVGAHTHDGSDSQALAADSVNATIIKDGAVSLTKLPAGVLAANATGRNKFADGFWAASGISQGKFAAGFVNATLIAAGAVGTSELAASAVNATILAANAANATNIADGAVILAKLPADVFAATSTGRAKFADGFWAASGVSQDKFDAGFVNATLIAAGAVGTSEMAADSVNATIVGIRVPVLLKRQGGSATDWSIAGATTVAPGAVRMQAGVHSFAVTECSETKCQTESEVEFPTAFGATPICILTPGKTWDYKAGVYVGLSTTNATLVIGVIQGNGDTAFTAGVNWLAIGPE